MTDLEITKLCAKAMEIKVVAGSLVPDGEIFLWQQPFGRSYSPLDDDAQAMALVKKCNLTIIRNSDDCYAFWTVTDKGFDHIGNDVDGDDLNRAICECVAKMKKGNS